MYHKYSQVISNRPGSEYESEYNNFNRPVDDPYLTTTTTTTTTTSNSNNQRIYNNYQNHGSSKVYQYENTHVNSNSDLSSSNDRSGRTYGDVENNIAPYQIKCPEGATGQFPYSLDCRGFLNCWKGRGFIQSCAPGTAFNPDTLECDNPEKVHCLGFHGEGVGNVNLFEKLQISTPPLPSTLFVKTNQDIVGCTSGFSGIEPHPLDCTKFLNCAHGLTHIQNCGPGTVFDSSKKICDFPDKVDCGNRVINFESTTNINEHYEAKMPYKASPTKTFSTTYTSYVPATYTNTQTQQYYDHPHTQGCNHHSHGQYNEHKTNKNVHWAASQNPIQSTAWKQYDVTHSQSPESTQIIQPATKWIWNTIVTSKQPQQTGGWSYTKNSSTINTQASGSNIHSSGNNGKEYNIIYSKNDDDLQQLTKSNYPNQENNQYPINPNWDESQTNINNREHRTSWIGSSSYNNQPSDVSYNLQSSSTPKYYQSNYAYKGHITPPQQNQPSVVYGYSYSPQTSSNHMMLSLTPSQELQKTIEVQDQNVQFSHSPIPIDYMLPPYRTIEEERNKIFEINGDSNYSLSSSKSFYPSDKLLPPLTPFEQHQKVNNSITKNKTYSSFIPMPSDQLLPPLTPEEEIKIAFNSSSSVIPILKNNTKSNEQRNPSSPQRLLPPYPKESNDYIKYNPSSEILDQKLKTDELFNNSVIVQSQTIKVVTPLSPLSSSSLYHTTTRAPPLYSLYNREYYKGSSASKTIHDDASVPEISNLPLSEALKSLLRPYFNRSGTVTNEDVQKTETHIMKIVKNNKNTNENINKKDDDGDTLQHKKDVEFIFAGEQSILNQQQPWKGSYGSSHRNDEDETINNHPHDCDNPLHDHNHNHNHHYHHHHHHHHRHHSDHHHGNYLGHSKGFHQSHPHLPNPFEVTTNNNNNENYYTTSRPTTPSISDTIPSPSLNFDVRFSKTTRNLNKKIPTTTPIYDADCKFDCQNGKCIKEFEVCDGINNCGNRLDEKYCDHLGYEIRLSNDQGAKNMGRVEVKILGKWGLVCDDKFGIKDADVICKELGFPLGASEVRGNSYYPPHSEMINENNEVLFVMDEVDCKGNETSLKDCNFNGWGVHDCSAEEVVGVVCKEPVMKCPQDYWLCSTSKECIPPAFVCDNVVDCADKSDEREDICNSTVEYRLVDGDGRLEGRLEIKYRGTWGTVCDDDFTDTEAKVVCDSLGFHGKAQVVKNAFGSGSGPIWLDQVSCNGNETSLDKCLHWTWGEHNCNHTEDVSIRCTEGPAPSSKLNGATNTGVKGRSSKQPEPADSEEVDMYLYHVQRSSKMFNDKNIKKCGHFNANLTDEFDMPEERVVQGTKTKRGHHPWQATIRTKGRAGKSTHWCGAVLISKKHLLTAAHCLMGYPKGAYFVRLGDHYANIAESSEIDVFIENWYIHEDFRKGSHMNNDIALIDLKSPVRFNDYIQPICLPSKDASYEPGKMCTISGWGSIQSGLSTPSNQLRAAQVPIIEDSICKRPIVYGNTITEGMFCAGYLDEGVDACDGDSGGPLVCTSNDAETLYGIISWGQHCGYANKPGVYVKISKYIDWINDKINFLLQSEKNK